MPSDTHTPPFVFFGTPEFAAGVLDELERCGVVPSIVVTGPDKPQGRHLVLTPPPVKVWAEARDIPVLQPQTLKTEEFAEELASRAPDSGWEFFVLAAYGKIIPKHILELSKRGILNVHPSLLPSLRGASPIQSAILSEDSTGVTIMLLDEEMDHGPIVAQRPVEATPWPPREETLEKLLASEGGKLLADIIPRWLSGEIAEIPQDHERATYCKKVAKEDGLIDLSGNPAANFRKIQAFHRWPGAYFFVEQGGKPVRIKIADAELRDGILVVKRIVPEGRREMNYDDFMRNIEK